MMVCFIATLGQILLLGFIGFTAANSKTCQIYAAVGESVTLPFNYEGLAKSHTLRWIHDTTIIFYRQQGRVTTGKPEDITTTGSMLLKSVKLQSAGSYQANALHPNGTLVKTWTGQLCVMEKVSKPRLSYSCDTNTVNLSCQVAKPQGLVFSWTIDKMTIPSETRQTLSKSLSQIKEDNNFSCSVANKVSAESSETVRVTCKAPMLCFKIKTVLGVLAGGAGLIFLLLIIITVLCCSYRHTKTMQLSDRREFKMLSVNNREAESITEYENIHNVESCPSPSPQTSSRACYQNISKLDVKTESKSSQLSTAAEGQQESPVPKPRTKNAKMQNI
ncbi:T-cell surface antigen CD2-like [Anableps anableps]